MPPKDTTVDTPEPIVPIFSTEFFFVVVTFISGTMFGIGSTLHFAKPYMNRVNSYRLIEATEVVDMATSITKCDSSIHKEQTDKIYSYYNLIKHNYPIWKIK